MIRKMMSTLKVVLALSAAVFGLALLQGCSGGGSDSDSSATAGTLKVALTDKLSDDFAEVRIKIKAVKIIPVEYDQDAEDDDQLLITVPLDVPSPSFNVLDLAYVQELLGTVTLPAGTYSQVRLILEPNPNVGEPVNYVTLKTDPATKIPLKTPSGQQSGLKVLGRFVVEPGVINAIAIDFDPNTAIVERGNTPQNEKYILKPTGIRIIQMDELLPSYGSISGMVVSPLSNWSSATVSVKRRGSADDITPIAAGTIFSNYTSGVWQAPFAAFVPPNTLPVTYKAFVAANGFQTYSSAAVSVVTGATTDLGTISLLPSP
ncbi:DUF4382 domain-containing protein [Geobacter benzoatilyticus]|uniref:DUF4382 domain-containing protein n=1 Tax=Geobacter benzoatilyticus TaxID=2815309 RepID=A0ABX7Q6K4_9BACT|nr:DUF4382 domain-containing protein [Geobacter benzoatilyticus]QSV47009.1 DUF4382 domain-containing protein [Geobacter benzoatilyticus]